MLTRDLHRPTHDHGERGRKRFELDVELAAKPAAEIGHLDADAVLRPAQEARDLGAHERGPLRAGVDGDAALLPIRNRRERLEREVQDFLGPEGVLEHMRGGGECLLDVAATQLEVERDIGASATLEMLEIGKGSGRPQLVMHQDLVIRRLDLVEDGRQLLIFGNDESGSRLGHMRVGSQHHGDGLADIMHFVDCEDRLIVKSRAVIWLRQ